MEIVIATRNPHKIEEIRQILSGLPVKLLSAADLGAPEVVEDEPTLQGNALKKAREVAAATDRVAIADDTGLLVEALGGRPGVYSARYAGPGATYADNVAKLLEEMKDVPKGKRNARFECVVAVAEPPNADPEMRDRVREGIVYRGILHGSIAHEPRGQNGFGYDPVFLVARDPKGRTLAELSADEKNRISHRARALSDLRDGFAEIAT